MGRVFEKYDMEHITNDILQEAAQLFSNNYGIWGKQAARFIGPFAKQGKCGGIIAIGLTHRIYLRYSCKDEQRQASCSMSSIRCGVLLRQGYC